MCRSIKTLREPYTPDVTEQDVRAAALQYVRKVSGFRSPARHNAEAFDRAVDAVAGATAELLNQLELHSGPGRTGAARGAGLARTAS
jgi:hypothetical protein